MRNRNHRDCQTPIPGWYRLRRALRALLLLCGAGMLTLPVPAAPPPTPGTGAEEPTVTRREAELLQEAMQVSTTNAAAAAAALEKGDATASSAAVDFALGNLHFQARNLKAAVSAYRRALDKHPTFTRATSNLARVHIMRERPDEALTLFRELVLRGRADADTYLLMGHALLLENRPVSAENAYRQGLLLDPESAEARFGLAKCLLGQERHAEALGLVSELLRLDAANSELWALRANALIALGRPTEAIRVLESARRLGRANGEMTATLGDLYLNTDMPGEAAACHREALQAGTVSAARTLRAIEALVALRRLDEAHELLPAFEQRLENNAEEARRLRPKLLWLTAQLARERGDRDEAVRLCEELVRKNPLDGTALLLLGDLLREDDALEDALMAYERAAGTQGREAEALVRQAQIEVERERYARAVELLEASLVFGEAPHVARYLEQVKRLVR
jgi:tetratricopeptide (TPR) repeat protein